MLLAPTVTPEPGATATTTYRGRTSEQAKRRASDDIAIARQHGWHVTRAVWRAQASLLGRVFVGPLSRLAPRAGVLEVTYEFQPPAAAVPKPVASVPAPSSIPPARLPPQRFTSDRSALGPWVDTRPRPPSRRTAIGRRLRPLPLASSVHPRQPPIVFRVCGLCEAFAPPTATECPQCRHDVLLDPSCAGSFAPLTASGHDTPIDVQGSRSIAACGNRTTSRRAWVRPTGLPATATAPHPEGVTGR